MRALVVAALAACSSGSSHPDTIAPCPIGDPAAPAELEIRHLDENFNVVATAPGAHVPLNFPPQGGWILLLGARARNIDGCHVNITTSFRDPCSANVIQLDRRPTIFDLDGDGWGTMRTTGFGNLPVCPEVAVKQDLHDHPYEITVLLEDANGKTAMKSMVVDPVCPDPDPTGLCLCQCDHNYVLGGSCPPGGADAGVSSCDAGT